MFEIDSYAANADNKQHAGTDLMILGVMRTGSAWTKTVVYLTGRSDDERCAELRKKETIIFVLRRFERREKQVDAMIAVIPPVFSPIAVWHGIAFAMHADVGAPCWGSRHNEEGNSVSFVVGDMTKKQREVRAVTGMSTSCTDRCERFVRKCANCRWKAFAGLRPER